MSILVPSMNRQENPSQSALENSSSLLRLRWGQSVETSWCLGCAGAEGLRPRWARCKSPHVVCATLEVPREWQDA